MKEYSTEEIRLGLLVAELAFRFAEKGNNLEATLKHVREFMEPRHKAAADRAEIDAAIRKFHIERGCCDGSFDPPCTFKLSQKAAKPVDDKPEIERPWSKADDLALKNARLERPDDE